MPRLEDLVLSLTSPSVTVTSPWRFQLCFCRFVGPRTGELDKSTRPISAMASAEKAAPVPGDAIIEAAHDEIGGTTHYAAGRGQLATDKYGHSTVQIDPKAESRLRLKIDFYIVPTVSLLYLFCFIDRANIGKFTPSDDRI